MSIRSVVTRGFGSYGSIPLVVVRGFGAEASAAVTTRADTGDAATEEEIRRLERAYRRAREAHHLSLAERRKREQTLRQSISATYRRVVENLPDVAEEISAAVVPQVQLASLADLKQAMAGDLDSVAAQMMQSLQRWQADIALARELERIRLRLEAEAEEADVEILLLSI